MFVKRSRGNRKAYSIEECNNLKVGVIKTVSTFRDKSFSIKWYESFEDIFMFMCQMIRQNKQVDGKGYNSDVKLGVAFATGNSGHYDFKKKTKGLSSVAIYCQFKNDRFQPYSNTIVFHRFLPFSSTQTKQQKCYYLVKVNDYAWIERRINHYWVTKIIMNSIKLINQTRSTGAEFDVKIRNCVWIYNVLV